MMPACGASLESGQPSQLDGYPDELRGVPVVREEFVDAPVQLRGHAFKHVCS